MILKASFLPVFFNLNGAKFKNLMLLLNRCQSLCQKGFVCVFVFIGIVPSTFKHFAFENSPSVSILQSYSQIFIVKYIDLNLVELVFTTKNCEISSVSGLVTKPSNQ